MEPELRVTIYNITNIPDQLCCNEGAYATTFKLLLRTEARNCPDVGVAFPHASIVDGCSPRGLLFDDGHADHFSKSSLPPHRPIIRSQLWQLPPEAETLTATLSAFQHDAAAGRLWCVQPQVTISITVERFQRAALPRVVRTAIGDVGIIISMDNLEPFRAVGSTSPGDVAAAPVVSVNVPTPIGVEAFDHQATETEASLTPESTSGGRSPTGDAVATLELPASQSTFQPTPEPKHETQMVPSSASQHEKATCAEDTSSFLSLPVAPSIETQHVSRDNCPPLHWLFLGHIPVEFTEAQIVWLLGQIIGTDTPLHCLCAISCYPSIDFRVSKRKYVGWKFGVADESTAVLFAAAHGRLVCEPHGVWFARSAAELAALPPSFPQQKLKHGTVVCTRMQTTGNTIPFTRKPMVDPIKVVHCGTQPPPAADVVKPPTRATLDPSLGGHLMHRELVGKVGFLPLPEHVAVNIDTIQRTECPPLHWLFLGYLPRTFKEAHLSWLISKLVGSPSQVFRWYSDPAVVRCFSRGRSLFGWYFAVTDESVAAALVGVHCRLAWDFHGVWFADSVEEQAALSSRMTSLGKRSVLLRMVSVEARSHPPDLLRVIPPW